MKLIIILTFMCVLILGEAAKPDGTTNDEGTGNGNANGNGIGNRNGNGNGIVNSNGNSNSNGNGGEREKPAKKNSNNGKGGWKNANRVPPGQLKKAITGKIKLNGQDVQLISEDRITRIQGKMKEIDECSTKPGNSPRFANRNIDDIPFLLGDVLPDDQMLSSSLAACTTEKEAKNPNANKNNGGRPVNTNRGNGKGKGRIKRQLFPQKIWATKQLSIAFAPDVDEKAPVIREFFRSIADEFARRSCIKLTLLDQPPLTTVDHILVTTALGGCWSEIGKQGGQQILSLELDGCVWYDTAVHELLHVLGIHHEQTRPDRDDYMKVDFSNVNDLEWANYWTCDRYGCTLPNTPYDVTSVMQYPKTAFALNETKAAMTPIKAELVDLVGTAQTMTQLDWKRLNDMYCLG